MKRGLADTGSSLFRGFALTSAARNLEQQLGDLRWTSVVPLPLG
jgi:hypothetical protein